MGLSTLIPLQRDQLPVKFQLDVQVELSTPIPDTILRIAESAENETSIFVPWLSRQVQT